MPSKHSPSTPAEPLAPEPATISLPDQPPTPQEQQFLRFLLQMHQSAYNRLREINSPWAEVVATAGQIWDDILAPDEEET